MVGLFSFWRSVLGYHFIQPSITLAACRRTRDLLQSAWTGPVFMQIIGTYARYASQISIKTASSQQLFATI
jgi:hypothetical protein